MLLFGILLGIGVGFLLIYLKTGDAFSLFNDDKFKCACIQKMLDGVPPNISTMYNSNDRARAAMNECGNPPQYIWGATTYKLNDQKVYEGVV